MYEQAGLAPTERVVLFGESAGTGSAKRFAKPKLEPKTLFMLPEAGAGSGSLHLPVAAITTVNEIRGLTRKGWADHLCGMSHYPALTVSTNPSDSKGIYVCVHVLVCVGGPQR